MMRCVNLNKIQFSNDVSFLLFLCVWHVCLQLASLQVNKCENNCLFHDSEGKYFSVICTHRLENIFFRPL
jgi:hypothetical protein